MLSPDVLREAIRSLPEGAFFGLLAPTQFERVFARMEAVELPSGTPVCEAGKPADTLWVVLKGTLDMVAHTQGRELRVGQAYPGQAANLRAVLVERVMPFMLRAGEGCQAIRVPVSILDEVLAEDVDLRTYLTRLVTEGSLQKFRQMLRAQDVPNATAKALIASLEPRACAPGEVIVEQGQVPDALYIVRSGRFTETLILGANEERFIGNREEGHFFGAECLVERLPSAHRIKADGEGTLFRLDPNRFRLLVIEAPYLMRLFPRRSDAKVREVTVPKAPTQDERMEAWLREGETQGDGDADAKTIAESAFDRLDSLTRLVEQEEAPPARRPAEPPDAGHGRPAPEYREAPSAGDREAEDAVERRERRARKKRPQHDPERAFQEARGQNKRYVHVNQRDEMDCGAACLAMISKYHGMDLGVSYFREAAHVSRDGTSLLALAQAAEEAGYTTRGVRVAASGLRKVNLPAIAHFGYHFVVLYEVADQYVVVGDPATTLDKMTHEEFAQRWDGILLLLEPTPKLFEHVPQKSSYKRYWRIIQPHVPLLRDVLLASFLIALLSLATPMLTQVILDRVLVHQNAELLNLVVGGLLAAVVFHLIAQAVRSYMVGYVAMRLDITLSTTFYRHLLRLPMRFFATRRVGDISTRMNDVEGIRSFLAHGAVGTLLDGIMLLVSVGVLVYYDWRLILLVLGFALPLVLLVKILGPRWQATFKRVAERRGEAASRLVEQVGAMSTIKTLAAEDLARWRWQRAFEGSAALEFHLVKLGMIMSSTAQGLKMVGHALVLFFGAKLALEGKVSVGQVIAISTLFEQIVEPMFRIADQWYEFQDVRVKLQRLNDVFDAPVETAPRRSPIRAKNLKGHLRFEGVSFGFQGPTGPQILQELDLEIAPGQLVALVGRSGSGKSTLIQLVNRLHDPLSGRVVHDGFDAREIPLPLLRRHVGVVLQDNALFSGTLLDNIAYGDDEPDMERVIHAATLANAHAFISQLPLGYGTMLAEGGVGLSGGQRQRIAIARALYHDPGLLILDEATSALDAESEQAILSNFRDIVRGRTTLVIAHRLNTVLAADKILVLDGGRIVESGTHRVLMDQKGLYHSLFSQQLSL
jgi:ATP-binding cassette subfamily B protein